MFFSKLTPLGGNLGFKVRDKVKSNAMSLAQWTAFLDELAKINERDRLIAKVVLQGGKRINEVLELTSVQIDWGKNEIRFTQSKTKGTVQETIITYPQAVYRLD
jgi:integrase